MKDGAPPDVRNGYKPVLCEDCGEYVGQILDTATDIKMWCALHGEGRTSVVRINGSIVCTEGNGPQQPDTTIIQDSKTDEIRRGNT